MIETAIIKIKSAIKECDSHVMRCNKAMNKLENDIPLRLDTFPALPDDTVTLIDQFIYRFTRLQDAMGLRLFPSLQSVIDDNYSPRPFLDILNRLEQLGIVESAADWQFFRNLRNNLAHDYPESVEQTVATLNILFTEWNKIQGMYSAAHAYFHDRIEGME